MGIKRTAKKGDFKCATSNLESLGTVEGSPKSIMVKLGFDGSWKEFTEYFGDSVIKTELGRYAVLGTTTNKVGEKVDKKSRINPELFAMCASAYILGEGNPEEFEPYTGKHDAIGAVTGALATEIDESIASIYLPYEKTVHDVELYTVERSLLYASDGDGRFSIFGSTVLASIR